MKRSRLRNIINKSKESSKLIGSPFDKFKKSLPIEVDDNYRLEAAWKAYGSPKDYKEALWQGMIQPIDENNVKLPSIGYNEETDEYEYLNKGRENETVNKDIRVWDNDVIPFVKELKQGGFIRTFDEEKDCWKYSKFQEGGKPKLNSKEAGEEPVGYLNDGTPLYKKGDGTIGPLTKENIGRDNLFDLIKNSNSNWAKRLQDPNRKYITYPDGSVGNFKLAWSEDETGTIVYPEIQEIDGQLVDLSNDREKAWKSAIEHKDYIYFPSNEAAEWFTKNYKNYYKGFNKTPQAFQQGGQLKKKHWKKPENWNDEKIPYEEWIKDVNPKYLNENYDLKTAYESEMPKEELERWKWAVNSDDPEYYMNYQDQDGNYIYHLGSVAPLKNGDYIFLKKGKEDNNPELHFETDSYRSGKNGLLNTHNLVYEGDRYYYRQKNPSAFKQGGQMNVIPEGALHARKNNMELAKEGEVTHKGVPVVDNDGVQQAEVEKEEWTMTKELTEDVEAWYRKYYDEETPQKEKDELAIKCGKRITKELLHNTDDRANLIAKMLEEEE